MPRKTKRERVEEFRKRLLQLPAAKTGEEALAAVNGVMNAVEDEFSGEPFDEAAADPGNRAVTERMYGPHPAFYKPAGPRVKRYVHRGHVTLLGSNGSIKIEIKGGVVFLEKRGDDGASVDDLLPVDKGRAT